MKRIGITQRVQENASYPERRDCLDQRWMAFFEAVQLLPVPLFNSVIDPDTYLEALGLDGFVLSGGNDIGAPPPDGAPERDRFERALLQFAQQRALPVIGVCRGMQMMQSFLGGPLVRFEGHAGTRHAIRSEDETRLPADVNSYHNHGISADDAADALRVLGRAPDGSVEAVRHQQLPWYAIMWHPERETVFADADLALFGDVLR